MRTFASGVALAALSLIAWSPDLSAAGHGRPGLWEVISELSNPLMTAMPKLTPEQAARLKERGIQMPEVSDGGRTVTARHCVTPQQAASDVPPELSRANSGCHMENMHTTSTGMTADLVCTGATEGNGKLQVTYASDTAYSGSFSFQGNAGGRPTSMTNKFSSKWLAADCGQMQQTLVPPPR